VWQPDLSWLLDQTGRDTALDQYLCCPLYDKDRVGKNGFWSTLYVARTDVSMVLGLVFPLLVAGGSLSLDAVLRSRRKLA